MELVEDEDVGHRVGERALDGRLHVPVGVERLKADADEVLAAQCRRRVDVRDARGLDPQEVHVQEGDDPRVLVAHEIVGAAVILTVAISVVGLLAVCARAGLPAGALRTIALADVLAPRLDHGEP